MKTTFYRIVAFCGTLALMYSGCKDIDVGSLKYERVDPDCPEVTRLSPEGARFGETVEIIGHNFFAGKPERHQVLINGTAIPQDSIIGVPSSESLLFKVPKGIGSGKVEVRIAGLVCSGQPGSGAGFTYYYTATTVDLLAGTPMVSNCTSGTQDCLNQPAGLDIDNNGNVFVADKFNHVVRKIAPSGSISVTYGKFKLPGCDELPVNNSVNTLFRTPIDVAVDPNGDIYVAEENNSIIRILKNSGSSEVFAGKCQMPTQDFADGNCSSALLSAPYSISKDGDNIYFIDNGRVRRATLNGSNCSNISTILVNNALTEYFRAIEISNARTGQGAIFIADEKAKNIKEFDLSPGSLPTTISPASSELSEPVALTLDSKGNIFIADKNNHKIYVLYTDGSLVVLAGDGTRGYTPNGTTGLNAQFNEPSGLAFDETRKILYVADKLNHVIRKISLQ